MDPATQDAMAADHFDATDKPFRFDLMLALLAELGTGPDALLAAEHEEGEKYVDVIEDETSNIHLLTPPPQVALKRQAVAQNIVTHMFLPLKAIAECSSVVPESDSDNDSDVDSNDGAPQDHDHDHEPRRPRSDGDLIQTYIFPPSPLSNMRPAGHARENEGDNGEGGDEGGGDDDAPESARRLAHYLTNVLDPNAVALLQRTAHDADANIITLSRAWSDRFRSFQAVVQPRNGRFLDDIGEYAATFLSGDDLVIRSLGTPLPLHAAAAAAGERVDDAMSIHMPPRRPSRELLYLHARIAFILHKTKAGLYIDRLLADNTEREDLALDGATMVGVLLQLRLDGWYHGSGRQRRRNNNTSDEPSNSRFWIDNAELVEEQ